MTTLTAPTIIKREIVSKNIRLTDNNGIMYHVLNNRVIGKDCFYDPSLQRWYSEYKNITPETNKDMLNANRDMTGFNNVWRNGSADEKRVIAFLDNLGWNIKPSSKEDNITKDIDCWVDGIGYSIKAEHKGLQWGNIYFELANQLTSTGQWEDTGWFNTGEADYYLILQGQELRMYSKQAIKAYVDANGWVKTRTLSWQAKATQGGSYRTMDTKSGFLDRDKVPYISSWIIA